MGVLLCLCRWVRLDLEGFDKLNSRLGASGRPCVITANHTSFMDIILTVALAPACHVGGMKMLVSNHVMKMPCLGQIIQAMNHVVVPFRKIGSELELGEEAMATDKELMVKRMQVLEDHVAEGGMV